MARDHARLRKLLQVQRYHLVNAEPAVRWWAQFDVFHFFTSVPIHTAVASLLLSSSTFRNFNHLSILASLRDIFGHARASYDNGFFSIPAHGLCHRLAKASQTTTTRRSATGFSGQAREQPPGFVATFGRPRQQHPTYGAGTSHTLPCASSTASPHTCLNHTVRQASLPYGPTYAFGA